MPTTLLSRAQIGLKQPVCFSSNFDLQGLTVHYPGPCPWGSSANRTSPEAFQASTDHNRCASIWRAYQDFHMGARNGCDIFYHGGVCPHGYRLEGRSKLHKSGAQGTADGNYRSFGIQYIGGVRGGVYSPLTDIAKVAFHDWSRYFNSSLRWGHRDWKSTDCPGTPVYRWKQAGFPLPTLEEVMADAASNWVRYYAPRKTAMLALPHGVRIRLASGEAGQLDPKGDHGPPPTYVVDDELYDALNAAFELVNR